MGKSVPEREPSRDEEMTGSSLRDAQRPCVVYNCDPDPQGEEGEERRRIWKFRLAWVIWHVKVDKVVVQFSVLEITKSNHTASWLL